MYGCEWFLKCHWRCYTVRDTLGGGPPIAAAHQRWVPGSVAMSYPISIGGGSLTSAGEKNDNDDETTVEERPGLWKRGLGGFKRGGFRKRTSKSDAIKASLLCPNFPPQPSRVNTLAILASPFWPSFQVLQQPMPSCQWGYTLRAHTREKVWKINFQGSKDQCITLRLQR